MTQAGLLKQRQLLHTEFCIHIDEEARALASAQLCSKISTGTNECLIIYSPGEKPGKLSGSWIAYIESFFSLAGQKNCHTGSPGPRCTGPLVQKVCTTGHHQFPVQQNQPFCTVLVF